LEYSFNRDRSEIVFAHMKDINASYKDLCNVCDSVRYKSVPEAIAILDSVKEGTPLLFRRHNKGMGSRHELGGKKGRYPIKCASIVKKAIVNASANASNKGLDPDNMFIVHATANKTTINRRYPSKGILYHRSGGYGYSSARRSDLEFAKLEVGIATGTEKGLSQKMQKAIEHSRKYLEKMEKQKPKAKPAKAAPKDKALTSPAGTAKPAKKPVHPEMQKRPEPVKTDTNAQEDKKV
jgi:ribosomal protein uL22